MTHIYAWVMTQLGPTYIQMLICKEIIEVWRHTGLFTSAPNENKTSLAVRSMPMSEIGHSIALMSTKK